MTVLKVATCQFPVSADIEQNAGWITRQMDEAARQGARVAHFPEGALSGYAGTDFETFTGYDWDALDRATDRVRERASELGIWLAAGSAHRFSDVSAPHNSLYVINDGGEVIERYDKRFLGGTDLDHYSPGSHFSTWVIDGIRCGALICYDYRFPELYRHYVTLDVQLMFHSFHAANASPERVAAIGAAIGTAVRAAQPGSDAHLPGHHHAGRDDRLGRVQQHVDLLPEQFSARRACGRRSSSVRTGSRPAGWNAMHLVS